MANLELRLARWLDLSFMLDEKSHLNAGMAGLFGQQDIIQED